MSYAHSSSTCNDAGILSIYSDSASIAACLVGVWKMPIMVHAICADESPFFDQDFVVTVRDETYGCRDHRGCCTSTGKQL